MQQPISIAELKSKLKAGARAKDAGAVVQAPGSMLVESIDEAARTATFVMSDATQDHVGDRLMPTGADLSAFMRNPQFLWMHDQDLPPIGQWQRVWMEGGQLKGVAYFTPPEIDEPGDPAHSFSERCWSLVKAGILKAVSVFFKTNEAEFNGAGFDVLDWTLLEASLVTVGMNPNALLEGKSVAQILGDRMKSKALNESTSSDGGAAVDTEKAMADCVKSLQDMHGQMAKALADHAKLMASHADIMGKHAKALADANAHADKLAAVTEDMKAALGGDDDAPEGETSDQKAARLAAKSGSDAHALSGDQHARAKVLAKTANAMLAAHHAAGGAVEPDADDGKSAPAAPAKPKTLAEWLAGLTPEQRKALASKASEEAELQLRLARGAVD